MKKFIAATALAVGLGAAGFAAGSVMPVGASTTPTSAAPSTSAPAAPPAGRGEVMQSVLAKLVSEGTITQSQADAVTAALKSAAAGRPGKGHPVLRAHIIDEAFDVSAATIGHGVTADALRADVRSGTSVATVAQKYGVDPQTVVKALVTAADKRVGEAVAAHRISQKMADRIEARVPDLAAKFVNFAGKQGAPAANGSTPTTR